MMFENQNSLTSIELLSAMRYFYDQAKKLKAITLLFSIILPLIYMGYRYAKNILNVELFYDTYLISGGLLWIIIMYFMERVEKDYIAMAAKTQEKFDINLFQIEKNDVLIYDDISQETIYDAAKSYKGNRDDLYDWYGKTDNEVPHNLKVLIAQRMNIIWGNELKKKYKFLLFILMAVGSVLSIGLAIYFNMVFVDTLIFLFFPLIPLFYLALKSIHLLKKQIKSNQVINEKILNDCKQLQKTNKIKRRCRLYQDYIYRENRINSILIPNWFYKFFKDSTNNKLLEINDALVKQHSGTQNATH